jgi:hypothetical protein
MEDIMLVKIEVKRSQQNAVNLGAQTPQIQGVQSRIHPDPGQDLDRDIVVETEIGPGLITEMLLLNTCLICYLLNASKQFKTPT